MTAGFRILAGLVLSGGLAVALSGCAHLDNLYAPNPAFGIDQDISELHDHFGTALSIQTYYATPPETEQGRNAFIAGRLSLYNLEYIKFASQFTLTKAQEESIFDLTTTGLGLATTITSGAPAKTVLGAVTTALTGARSSFEKDFFNQQTASALITQMNAQRKAALVPLLAGMKQSVADYPLSSAIVDLNQYQVAGTIEGALEGIQTDASVKDAAAQTKIDLYRNTSFTVDDPSERISAWLFPGVKTYGPAGPLDANGQPVVASAANVAALKAYLTTKGLDGLPIATFLHSSLQAAARTDAISTLHIP